MDTLHAMPLPVTLQPLRAFHIDQGQGRAVAVLFRVAVHRHGSNGSNTNKQARNKQAGPQIEAVP